jgi:AAA+ ATPase superfamily predicted ATPase
MIKLPPGIPSNIDKYFYNRRDELVKLKMFIKSLEDDVASQILVMGYRGVGKSFLLIKLIQDLPPNILTAYIDISKIYGMQKGQITEEKILKTLLKEMEKTIHEKTPKNTYNQLHTLIPKLKNKKYDFKDAGSILGISIPQTADDYEKLSQFVMEFPQKVVDQIESIDGFVIVIDEFQLLGGLKSPEAFFWLIRSYTQNQDNVSYIFTGSTSSTSSIIDKINGFNGAYGGRMIPFLVEPFNQETTRNYLKDKINELKFTEDGLERFYKCTRGFPAYINSFCSVMPTTWIYDAEAVTSMFYDKIDQIAVMWISIWSTLQSKEKDIVTILVEYGPQNWKNLLDKAQLSSKTLVKYLDSLKNKGIVTHTNKIYKIEDHMLSTWLKNKKETEGYYPP